MINLDIIYLFIYLFICLFIYLFKVWFKHSTPLVHTCSILSGLPFAITRGIRLLREGRHFGIFIICDFVLHLCCLRTTGEWISVICNLIYLLLFCYLSCRWTFGDNTFTFNFTSFFGINLIFTALACPGCVSWCQSLTSR